MPQKTKRLIEMQILNTQMPDIQYLDSTSVSF